MAGNPVTPRPAYTARVAEMSAPLVPDLGIRLQRRRDSAPAIGPRAPVPYAQVAVTSIPFVPSSDGAKLAVVLRSAQWTLDDLAHDLPAGRCTPQRLRDLATVLEQLATALRAASGEAVT